MEARGSARIAGVSSQETIILRTLYFLTQRIYLWNRPAALKKDSARFVG